MAYAAAVSLKDTLSQFSYLSDRNAHVHHPETLSFIESLVHMAGSIQEIDFEEYRPRGESLEMEIRDALWRAEDVIDSYMLSRFHSSEDIVGSSEDMIMMSPDESGFSQDLQKVVQELKSGKDRMAEFIEDLKHVTKEDPISIYAASSSVDLPPQCKNRMVGLDQELEEIKEMLGDYSQHEHLGAFVITGMGGIGKTCLAVSICNDSDVRDRFCVGAWVKISLEHCVRGILLNLLHTVEEFGDKGGLEVVSHKLIGESDDEGLETFVREIFAREKYLVVIDCLSEINMDSWGYIKNLLPDSNNGSRIILVNRWLFEDEDEFIFEYYEKRFLESSKGWELLTEQVFGDKPCPRELKKIGRKIAENCQGLPLAIITVGLHLAKEGKTVEYWSKVAESGNSVAYAVDGAPMFEQLGLSYKQMPLDLRPIFLYMGTYPESSKIDFSELANSWIAEGFVGREDYSTPEHLMVGWIQYFSQRNLVTIETTDSINALMVCSLHHALWHFCSNQAKKDEFFHVMDKYINDWEDLDIDSHLRRLIIWKNVLLAIKDFGKLKNSLVTVRSLLLTGPFHSYPLPNVLSTYKKLKVLKVRSVRFYEFPVEILYLSLLRYLDMTVSKGELPAGISKLRNLLFLIVHVHQTMRSSGGTPLYLPIEIWEMQELMHLEVRGSDLPVPHPGSGAKLPNLLRIIGVTPHSCTKEVLERIPNLRLLRIHIDLAPKNDKPPFCPFDQLALLQRLQYLWCIITNPYFEEGYPIQPQVVSMPKSISDSMGKITHLMLSGCGFHWNSMKQISQLPVLEVLYLDYHAFRGPKWELTNGDFQQLKTLYLRDLDLVYWTATSGHDQFFPCLQTLAIWRCHKLQHISPNFAHGSTVLSEVEVLDSSREVEIWARSVQESFPPNTLSVRISSPRAASTSTN